MKRITRELASYTVFGVLTTIISILSYKLFLLVEIKYLIAQTGSSSVAVLFAYITNRVYVFKSKNNIKTESIKFFIARIAVFFIETLMLFVLVSYLDFDEFYSKVAVVILVVIANYVLSKFIVFRESKRRVYFEEN